jgi:TMEM175 potassium channel family protein
VPKTPSSSTVRLEAFSDGVIAIAITLLILNIKIPHAKDGKLLDAVTNQWPSYAAFVVSFAVIGIMWVSHHSMFQRIANTDRPLLFLNLLLLLGIAFLPYPTALLGAYVRDGGSNSHIAAAVYSTTMVGIGLAFAGLWWHLSRRPELLVDGIPPENVHRAVLRSLVGPAVYTATVGLAFVSAAACFVVYAGIAIYFAMGPSSRAATPDEEQMAARSKPAAKPAKTAKSAKAR